MAYRGCSFCSPSRIGLGISSFKEVIGEPFSIVSTGIVQRAHKEETRGLNTCGYDLALFVTTSM